MSVRRLKELRIFRRKIQHRPLRSPAHRHIKPELGAGWSSPVARQAHNLKVVGSNPTPATKSNKTPPTYSVGGVCRLSILRPNPASLGSELRHARFNFHGDSYIALHDCRTSYMRDPSVVGCSGLGARWRGGARPCAVTWIIGRWDRPYTMAGEILVSAALLSDRG